LLLQSMTNGMQRELGISGVPALGSMGGGGVNALAQVGANGLRLPYQVYPTPQQQQQWLAQQVVATSPLNASVQYNQQKYALGLNGGGGITDVRSTMGARMNGANGGPYVNYQQQQHAMNNNNNNNGGNGGNNGNGGRYGGHNRNGNNGQRSFFTRRRILA